MSLFLVEFLSGVCESERESKSEHITELKKKMLGIVLGVMFALWSPQTTYKWNEKQ